MATLAPKDTVELLVLGWIRLLIENHIENIPIEIKFVCKEFFGALIDSSVLTMDEENLVMKYIFEQTKMNWNWKLLYRATEHGFKRDDFYNHCKDKGNTVVIIHNEHDFVFGGYTPCKWIKRDPEDYDTITAYGADESMTTCLFILRTKVKDGATILRLKEEHKHEAVSYYPDTAFDFGCNDLYFCGGYVDTEMASEDCCFEWKGERDEEYKYIYGPSDGGKPDEIEIYQLH